MRRLLFRYLLGELAGPLVGGIIVFSSILMMSGLLRASEYLSSGGALFPTAGLLASMLPYLLVLTIPMALLLSVMLTYGRLSEDHEILAIRAGGVPYRTIYTPALTVGVILFAVMLFLEHRIAPAASEMEKGSITGILEQALPPDLAPGRFNTRYGRFPIYFREIDPVRRAVYGVIIGSVTDGVLETVVTAPEARIRLDMESKTLDLILEEGTFHSLAGERHSTAGFQNARVSLNVAGPLERLTRGRNEYRSYRTEDLLAEARRTEALPDTPEYHSMKRKTGRFYRAWHERYSVPAICLVLPLIAVPLALVTRTGRRSAAFAASLFLIFLYYLLFSLGKSLVTDTFISAAVGSWLPIGVLFLAGTVLTAFQVRR